MADKGGSGVRLDSRGKRLPRKASLLVSARAVFKPVVDRIDSLELQVSERWRVAWTDVFWLDEPTSNAVTRTAIHVLS